MELEPKIIIVSSPFVVRRCKQIYTSTQDFERERELWEAKGNYTRNYIDNNNTHIKQDINARVLFAWWIIIQSMVEDLRTEGHGNLGEQIVFNARESVQTPIPKAFVK